MEEYILYSRCYEILRLHIQNHAYTSLVSDLINTIELETMMEKMVMEAGCSGPMSQMIKSTGESLLKTVRSICMPIG